MAAGFFNRIYLLIFFPDGNVITLLRRRGEHRDIGDFLCKQNHEHWPGRKQFTALTCDGRVVDFEKSRLRF